MNKERKKKLEANIWKFGIMRFLRYFMLIMPIIVLFFQENGLNLKEIMILQASFSFVVVVLEIPSGFISDVFDRKLSMILGSTIGFAGFLIYCFAWGFYPLLLAEIVLAIGASFLSGTGDALLYDSLLELKREKENKKIMGKVMMFSHVSEAIAAVVGGFLALYALRLPFYAEAFVAFFIIPLAFSLLEPRRQRFTHKKGHVYGMYKILRFALYKNKDVKMLIFYSALLSTGTLVAVWFYQPYFKLVGLPLALFGIMWAILNFANAFFANYAHNIEDFLGKRKAMISLAVAVCIGYVVMGSFPVLLSIIMVLCFSYVRGVQNVVITDYINKVTWSDKRATVMSIKALISRLLFVVFSPFIGWYADVYTLPAALLLSALFVFIFAGGSLIFLYKHEVI